MSHNCSISLKFRRNISLLGKEQQHLSNVEIRRDAFEAWLPRKEEAAIKILLQFVPAH